MSKKLGKNHFNQIIFFCRNFYIAPTLQGTYPVHLNDEDTAALLCEQQHKSLFKNHFFNYKDMSIRQRKRRADIMTGIAPLRGVPSIRMILKAKVDESQILPHTREGLAESTSYQEWFRQQNEELSDLKLFINKPKSSV